MTTDRNPQTHEAVKQVGAEDETNARRFLLHVATGIAGVVLVAVPQALDFVNLPVQLEALIITLAASAASFIRTGQK